MRTVLIANRGEIALRIARTCERLHIDPVMIHTPTDEGAPHTSFEYVREVSSYLDIEAVIQAALDKKADAIHPGYGFLSERAEFARAVEAAGLILVGPSAEVMDKMGRKDAAREIAIAAGVPVVPSFPLVEQGAPATVSKPRDIQFPVLVKATAGGGGKGMRIVRSAGEYAAALAAARREALTAFGDDTMLIEKYVERGRHIEVQVFGDSHGNVVHLFERDCSTQRRHQKVLEEAPAPTITDAQRASITASAVSLAREVGYTNAGTVEFLLDEDTGEFYFLEMNTRLQVEHPVTEEVVRVKGKRIDLVELQLRIADGEPLGFTQDDVTIEGHAIEARIYAEDAYGGFLPQAGTATVVRWPLSVVEEGAPRPSRNPRVDHALRSGQVVSTHFDPMLGKVIAHGSNREVARRTLISALDDTAIFGLTTNVGYLRALAATDEFRDATIDTAWLDHHELPAPDEAGALALVGLVLHGELKDAPAGPWQPDGFRAGGPRGGLFEDGRELKFGGWIASPDKADKDGVQKVGIFSTGDGFVRRTTHATEVIHQGQRFVFVRATELEATQDASDGTVVAPMPGTVLDVLVSVGQHVVEGETLGAMEAMKMELALKAPFAGTVTEVHAGAGQQVSLGATLVVVEAASAG